MPPPAYALKIEEGMECVVTGLLESFLTFLPVPGLPSLTLTEPERTVLLAATVSVLPAAPVTILLPVPPVAPVMLAAGVSRLPAEVKIPWLVLK